VRLLLKIAPAVFHSGKFALKGGTAINLFIREMPRLSVDLDLIYIDHTKQREDAFSDISASVNEMCTGLKRQGFDAFIKPGVRELDSKVFVRDGNTEVKVEINHVMRGVISTVEATSITQAVKDRFKTNVTVPMVSHDEVYAGKLVAAMDRQHPRDLFDVHQLINNEGISKEMVHIFVVYLASHNRPIHEVLFGNMLDIENEYKNNFVGMTEEDIPLKTLTKTRELLFETVQTMLTDNHKQFLVSLASAEPDWQLLNIQHLQDMPGMKWKIQNIKLLKDINPNKFAQHIQLLNTKLSEIK
jgi:hypothetical protein